MQQRIVVAGLVCTTLRASIITHIGRRAVVPRIIIVP